jgi:ComF family protein
MLSSGQTCAAGRGIFSRLPHAIRTGRSWLGLEQAEASARVAHFCESLGVNAAAAAVNLLFPSPCRVCGAPLRHARRIPVCEACLATVTTDLDSSCSRCGQAALYLRDGVCPKCAVSPPPYAAALSAADYQGAARSLILFLKFRRVAPVAGFLAAKMAGLAPRLPATPDLVLPVPLGARRQRQRGFNQSEAIGKRLAHHLRCSYAADGLHRVRETAPQSGLTAPERVRNVAGAFAADPRRVRGQRVVLVDDVLTTGATAGAATAALIRAGARDVVVMTAARAVREHRLEAA